MESLTDENLPAQRPIQRPPLALLSKIIHESVDGNKFAQYTVPFSNDVCVQSEAVNIGLISRRWRHVSLLIPEIWSCITLKIEGGEEDAPGLLRALDTHIQRSKNVPLRVNVKLSGSFRYDDEYPALGKLLSHAHRWVELALTVDEFEDAFEEEYYLFLYLIKSSPLDLRISWAEMLIICFGSNLPLQEKRLTSFSLHDRLDFWDYEFEASDEDNLRDNQPVDYYTNFLSSSITTLDVHVAPGIALSMLTACPNIIDAQFALPISMNPAKELEASSARGYPHLRNLTLKVFKISITSRR
ncbi:hypothetical protein AAF712_010670 [Marasmius tenuissimus]|uniref:F-box domain-containing protein n=1 Tax=Marasmius tenuissimus TaxID=585030 RepID=A0ABR2ZM81_9AGAR